ncbi:MAG: hypothetical protein MUO35_06610 [Anaerolineales bacterium]|nr:hypothetical protein [Anaerolineales bacterium]
MDPWLAVAGLSLRAPRAFRVAAGPRRGAPYRLRLGALSGTSGRHGAYECGLVVAGFRLRALRACQVAAAALRSLKAASTCASHGLVRDRADEPPAEGHEKGWMRGAQAPPSL